MKLPLGQRFRFASGLSIKQAKEAIKQLHDKEPDKLDNLLGGSFGPLIYVRQGLLSSAPQLVALMRERDGELEVRGTAGLNLMGLAFFALLPPLLILFGAMRLVQNGEIQLLVFGVGFAVFWPLVALSNHAFRADAKPLIRKIERALVAKELEAADRVFSSKPVTGVQLLRDGEVEADPPSPLSVREAVIQLGKYHFLILQCEEQTYMQLLNDDKDYRLEYRAGGPDRHFRASRNVEQDVAIEAMLRYLESRSGLTSINWERIEFDPVE